MKIIKYFDQQILYSKGITKSLLLPFSNVFYSSYQTKDQNHYMILFESCRKKGVILCPVARYYTFYTTDELTKFSTSFSQSLFLIIKHYQSTALCFVCTRLILCDNVKILLYIHIFSSLKSISISCALSLLYHTFLINMEINVSLLIQVIVGTIIS